jgi:hypothetical protein
MEEPNANGREWAMGFDTNATTMQGIFVGTHTLKEITQNETNAFATMCN